MWWDPSAYVPPWKGTHGHPTAMFPKGGSSSLSQLKVRPKYIPLWKRCQVSCFSRDVLHTPRVTAGAARPGPAAASSAPAPACLCLPPLGGLPQPELCRVKARIRFPASSIKISGKKSPARERRGAGGVGRESEVRGEAEPRRRQHPQHPPRTGDARGSPLTAAGEALLAARKCHSNNSNVECSRLLSWHLSSFWQQWVPLRLERKRNQRKRPRSLTVGNGSGVSVCPPMETVVWGHVRALALEQSANKPPRLRSVRFPATGRSNLEQSVNTNSRPGENVTWILPWKLELGT